MSSETLEREVSERVEIWRNERGYRKVEDNAKEKRRKRGRQQGSTQGRVKKGVYVVARVRFN